MRIAVGVDWSDEAFAAVEQVGLLYRPDDVVLIHGVDLGVLQFPIVAGAINLQGYDEFRQALMDAGRQAIERCRTLMPAKTPPSERCAKSSTRLPSSSTAPPRSRLTSSLWAHTITAG